MNTEMSLAKGYNIVLTEAANERQMDCITI